MLTNELEAIRSRKRRQVQKRNNEHFTVGLVGYTNAGKSTLFNTLTAGGAYADDRVFATLMTRTRDWDLGGGFSVMLSDTVGFVRDLPHHLVASFRATLEEATHADLLLIVLDVAERAAELHLETVRKVLGEVFEEVQRAEDKAEKHSKLSGRSKDAWSPPPVALLLNKADKLASNEELLIWKRREPDAIPICSLADDEGQLKIGHDALLDLVRTAATGEPEEVEILAPLSEAKAINTIETKGEVHDRDYNGQTVTLKATIGGRILERLLATTPGLEIAGKPRKPQPPAWREPDQD